MLEVLRAFGLAFHDLRSPRILAVMLLPMLGAVAIWTLLSWLFWDALTGWLDHLVTATAAGRWLEEKGAGWLVRSLSTLGLLVLLVPAVLATAMVIAELAVMPATARYVSARYHPGLERKAGGTLAGSIVNSAAGIGVFLSLWILTLPLWLTGIAAFILPPVLSAYMNQRLFRYDALADHASREEYRALVVRARPRLFVLGLMVAALYYVPVLNLVAPTLSALAFAHLCLAELERLRKGG